MKLIGYIRVSTDEQAKDGQSLSIQDLQLHKYCELHGHELIDVIVDDGVSASINLDKRPAGFMLLDRLKDKEADGFVVQRLDRAFRITIDGLLTAELFNKRGLTIHSVNEHIDTTTAFGKFVLRSMLSMAELERDKISERATETFEGLRDQAKPWGPTPFGLVRVGDKLYRDKETWAVREAVISLRDTLSLRAVCTELQQRDIASPSGGKLWHPSTLIGIINNHNELKHIPFLKACNEARVS